VILLDANLLIYAIDTDSPHHRRVRSWLEEVLSGAMGVILPWISILAFLRITTHPRIMGRPLGLQGALAYVDEWLRHPNVTAVGPSERHWPILRHLLWGSGTAGNLTSDAHLAALAVEHGCTVCSADNDFRRFASVPFFNPLNTLAP
jgi:uncharacterized protein